MNIPAPYNPLHDTILMGEMEWVVAQFTEKFLCNDNTLPCSICCERAKSIALLFMSGYGIVGKALEDEAQSLTQYLDANKNAPSGLMTRAVIRLVLDKMNQQKWILDQPWKRDAKPKVAEENKSSIICSIDIPKIEREVVFKLAKRKREGV